ncbi:hypothetical protein TEA_006162 [Camellia sinensis var. sinensis]|uniref:DAGKc domain-containing protein n=1 Tax=Camellia sinensis var. sinensis TaxID=542762 RepID=A0A4S4DIP8_CAMSN|nr:hypothetical protein TEA_006162 [Camellia sinensis var. sinensis]
MADYNPEFDNLKKFYIPNYILVPSSEGECLPDVLECPVLVFINSKSGGHLGGDLLITYSSLLNKKQVVDLLEAALDAVLHRLYLNLEKLKLNGDELALRIQENLRIIVAGGDGTTGWLLGVVSDLKLSQPPPIATVPPGNWKLETTFHLLLTKKNPGTYRHSVISFLDQVMKGKEMKIDSIVVPDTKPLEHAELSQSLKNLIGYTLELKPSQIPHKDAGQGLFIDGQANVGTVIAFYPGIIYSPAYYRYIPRYPRVDTHNPYLITMYDRNCHQWPWGVGVETCEVWDLSSVIKSRPTVKDDANNKGSDRIWKMLDKPLQATRVANSGNVLERRNPLALVHFANHPAKEMVPNVMVCPYDFPLTEKDMRTYIPNITFGSGEEAKIKRFGSFCFKSWRSSNGESDVLVLKALVLVATRPLCDEEVLLNYRLINSKKRPSWYIPVDEEEDRRRWS